MSGEADWLKARRPHGNPPKGTRPRTSSSVIHSAAVHSGQPGSRVTRAIPVPSKAKYSASKTLRASHASMPTGRNPSKRGKQNARP